MKMIKTTTCALLLAALTACSGGGSGVKQKGEQGMVVPERFSIANYTQIGSNTGNYAGVWMFTQSGRGESAGTTKDYFIRGLVYITEDNGSYTVQQCSTNTATAVSINGSQLSMALGDTSASLSITDENNMSGTASATGLPALNTQLKKVRALDAAALGSFTMVRNSDSLDETFTVRCFFESYEDTFNSDNYKQTLVLGHKAAIDYGFVTAAEEQAGTQTARLFRINALISSNAGGVPPDNYTLVDNQNVEIIKTLISNSGIQLSLRGSVGNAAEFSSQVTASF